MNYGRQGIKQKKKLLNSAATRLRTKLGVFAIKFILILAIVLVYKIINKSNEETDVASINTQQDNISFINNGYDSTFSEEVQANMIATDVLTTYKNNKKESVEENNKPIIKDNTQNQYNLANKSQLHP